MERTSCIVKQVIRNEQLVSYENCYTEKFSLITKFIINRHVKIHGLQDIVTHQEILRLKPYINNHICIKEKELGKSRIFFTNEERKETINEFQKVLKTANSILSGKVKVEELLNEAW